MPDRPPAETEPSSAQQVIHVVFDRERLRLDVTPSSVFVRPGDLLIWRFVDLPADFFPWIRFVPEAGESADRPKLPIGALSQSAGILWAEVVDVPRQFTYRAMIQTRFGNDHDDQPAHLASAPALISPMTSPTVHRVHVVETDRGMIVTPGTTSVHRGDQIVWDFHADNLRDSQGVLVPRVQFTTGPGPLRDLQLGPFTSLTYQPGPDGGTSVVGTGYAGNPTGAYRYRVLAFRQSSGEIVWASSPDPTVDDEGPPPYDG